MGDEITVGKLFDIPVDFDVSDKLFEIGYNRNMNNDTAVQETVDAHFGYGGHGSPTDYSYSASSTLSKTTPGRTQADGLINTYYIYTFDGKLLAEYDHNGTCVKDYIYMGNRLIAEYKPQTGEYFYYMTDQINSTRIITDGSGNVVFSEAAGPYGDIQKTWTNTYEPKLNSPGKKEKAIRIWIISGHGISITSPTDLILLTRSSIEKKLFQIPSCGVFTPIAGITRLHIWTRMEELKALL